MAPARQCRMILRALYIPAKLSEQGADVVVYVFGLGLGLGLGLGFCFDFGFGFVDLKSAD